MGIRGFIGVSERLGGSAQVSSTGLGTHRAVFPLRTDRKFRRRRARSQRNRAVDYRGDDHTK